MLLKTRTLVSFILVIVTIFSSQILTRIFIELPEYRKLENLNDRKDISTLQASLRATYTQIEILCKDYANWDDTVEFILSEDMTYIDSNFPEKHLIESGLNGAIYLDNNKNIIYSRTEESRSGRLINDPFTEEKNRIFLNRIFISKEQVKVKDSSLSNTGLLLIDNKPVIFSITSITDSEGSPTSYGNLLFWKFFDMETINKLLDTTQLNLHFDWLTEDDRSHKYFNIPSPDNTDLDKYSRNRDNRISLVINDFFRKPVLILEIQKTGHDYDDRIFSKNLIAGIITSLFTILFLFYFININFLVKIKTFLNHFKKVEETDDYSLKLEMKRNDELSVLADSINMLMEKINLKKQFLESSNRELEFLSNTDALTQIPNRRHLDIYLEEKWKQAFRECVPVSICICDVDFFKLYNDNYGHRNGDMVLREVASSLKNNLHLSTDFVARYGGEEFAIILYNTDTESSCRVANNLLNSVENMRIPHSKSECSSFLTISIGISTMTPASSDNLSSFVESADRSLYTAKKSGRNRFVHSNNRNV